MALSLDYLRSLQQQLASGGTLDHDDARALVAELARRMNDDAIPIEVSFGVGAAGLWEGWLAEQTPRGLTFHIREDNSSLPRSSDSFETNASDLEPALKVFETWRARHVMGQPLVQHVRARRRER